MIWNIPYINTERNSHTYFLFVFVIEGAHAYGKEGPRTYVCGAQKTKSYSISFEEIKSLRLRLEKRYAIVGLTATFVYLNDTTSRKRDYRKIL